MAEKPLLRDKSKYPKIVIAIRFILINANIRFDVTHRFIVKVDLRGIDTIVVRRMIYFSLVTKLFQIIVPKNLLYPTILDPFNCLKTRDYSRCFHCKMILGRL